MKCHFVRQEVKYLGHTITPAGLKPNDEIIESNLELFCPHKLCTLAGQCIQWVCDLSKLFDKTAVV